jgi:solute carrier family 25 phosphate transporter 23/24/25/41
MTNTEEKKVAPKKDEYRMEGKDSTIGFFTAGAIAGAVSRTVASPFERMKILFQVEDLTEGAKKQKKYTGIWQTVVQIYKEEGWVGYFKGNGTNVVRIIPINAIQFLSYEKYKKWIGEYQGTLNTYGRLSAGALAGMTSTLATYPLDLVRCRLSAQHEVKKYTGIINAFKVILKEEGFIGWYRGLVPSLIGIAPYVAINFTSFETLKRVTIDYFEVKELGVITKLTLGAIAGTISQTITYPLETVRRRMQMASLGTRSGAEGATMIQAFKQVYTKYGLKGYFKGLIPNYIKVIPVVSVNFLVYEWCKKIMGLSRGAKDI